METSERFAAETSGKQPISIAGAGNRLILHDRIGPRVLRLIRGRYGSRVELCDIGTSGLHLLDYLRGQALLVIIDACLMNEAPGTIRVLESSVVHGGYIQSSFHSSYTHDDSLLPDTSVVKNTSVHQIGPIEVLAVAGRLYKQNMPHRVLLIMVETRDIDTATERKACREVVGILDREVGLCKSLFRLRLEQ